MAVEIPEDIGLKSDTPVKLRTFKLNELSHTDTQKKHKNTENHAINEYTISEYILLEFLSIGYVLKRYSL